MTVSRRPSRLARAGLLAILAIATAAATPARGNDEPWRFRITPYLWAPALHGDTAVSPSQPTAEADGYNLLDALEFAVLATGEARKGDFFLLGEVNYIELADDHVKIRDRTTSTAEIEMDVFETSLAAGHRVYKTDDFGIDLFGGLRYWQIDTTVSYTLSGSVIGSPNRRFDGSKGWVDPIVGARIEVPFGESWFAGLLGDIGGFGVGSRLQWEAVARAGYRFNDTWALSGGYRHVTVDFEDGGFLLDATLTGPFIALDINF